MPYVIPTIPLVEVSPSQSAVPSVPTIRTEGFKLKEEETRSSMQESPSKRGLAENVEIHGKSPKKVAQSILDDIKPLDICIYGGVGQVTQVGSPGQHDPIRVKKLQILFF